MKRWSVVGLLLTSFCGVSPVEAKPDLLLAQAPPENRIRRAPPTGEQLTKMLNRKSPAQVVELFLHYASWGETRRATFMLSGADWQSGDSNWLGDMMAGGREFFWQVSFDPAQEAEATRSVAELPAGGDELKLRVKVGVRDELEAEVSREEMVTLRREQIKGGSVWRIVPEKSEIPDNLAESPLGKTSQGVLGTLISYYAQPKRVLEKVGLSYSASQLKYLGMGLLQLVQDYDLVFQLDAANMREKMLPYVMKESLWTAPGDTAKVQSYQFNPNLALINSRSLKKPTETVMLFLGKPDQLDFRYDGKTVVCFADGHVEAVDAERAKGLRWTP
jgi:prepilin-type processing-associated H-X9-DG protein